jgi:hypothetical protein
MVMHACNPSPGEAEVGGLQVSDEPGIHSKNLSKKRGERKKKNFKD